ncbi:MAG: IS1595 family transposase [bacterium]
MPHLPSSPEPEDFPRTLAEFERRFAAEESCRAYLMQLRWPEGFRCPSCGGERAWPTGRGAWLECASCHRHTSPTVGTIFEGTRTSLVTWFRAMWYVTNQKVGVSALGLQRCLGLGSYQTAWAWLHKLRRAMVRPGRDRLAGEVEVDETYVGGVEPRGGRRHLGNKALVVVAAQLDGKGIGRIRLRRVADASSRSLHAFVQEAIVPGTTVITDGWEGYEGLNALGYLHGARVISGSGKTASILLPRVHRVASLLKRWLLGTHQGAVSREHLDYYLDEFTFRFNRRKSRSRAKLFYRLVQQAVATPPVRYQGLVRRDHCQTTTG